ELLREIVAGFYREIEEGEFDFEVDIPEDEVLLSFDRVEMGRAISNILGNAIKYNPSNTRLFISLEKSEAFVVIKICDDGVGINEELKANIFEPFTRGDSSRRSVGGTGLGLSISKKIIEMHGGDLTLESEENFKTVFKILISKV
ncbi:MAG: sensor histidine kinase, partial [Clostridium sp.]